AALRRRTHDRGDHDRRHAREGARDRDRLRLPDRGPGAARGAHIQHRADRAAPRSRQGAPEGPRHPQRALQTRRRLGGLALAGAVRRHPACGGAARAAAEAAGPARRRRAPRRTRRARGAPGAPSLHAPQGPVPARAARLRQLRAASRRCDLKRWLVLAAVLAIAACAGNDRRPDAPEEYIVRAGDTLYSIARRYGLDYRDVARWNGISPDDIIRPGDRLRLEPAAGAATARRPEAPRAPRASPDDPEHRPPTWRWPVDVGTVAGLVRQPSGGVGLRIDGGLNQPILAAADGKVVYTGSALRGYGQLVIINHVRGWLTAYGHNAFVQ